MNEKRKENRELDVEFTTLKYLFLISPKDYQNDEAAASLCQVVPEVVLLKKRKHLEWKPKWKR